MTKTVRLLRDSKQLHPIELAVSTRALDAPEPTKYTNFHSVCYMRLAVSVDISLNTGHVPDEEDIPSRFRNTSVDEAGQGEPATVLSTQPGRLAGPSRGQPSCNACSELTPGLHGETGLQTDLVHTYSDMRSFEGEIAIHDFLALESAFAKEVEDNWEMGLWWQSESYTGPSASTGQLGDWFNESEDQGPGLMVVNQACPDEACDIC